jgi:hypothetical protein
MYGLFLAFKLVWIRMKLFRLLFVVPVSSGRYMTQNVCSFFAVINVMINVTSVRFHFVSVLSDEWDVIDEQLRSIYHQYRQ